MIKWIKFETKILIEEQLKQIKYKLLNQRIWFQQKWTKRFIKILGNGFDFNKFLESWKWLTNFDSRKRALEFKPNLNKDEFRKKNLKEKY